MNGAEVDVEFLLLVLLFHAALQDVGGIGIGGVVILLHLLAQAFEGFLDGGVGAVVPRPASPVHLKHLTVDDGARGRVLQVERQADLGIELRDLVLLTVRSTQFAGSGEVVDDTVEKDVGVGIGFHLQGIGDDETAHVAQGGDDTGTEGIDIARLLSG